jgi:hypothetical protein
MAMKKMLVDGGGVAESVFTDRCVGWPTTLARLLCCGSMARLLALSQ